MSEVAGLSGLEIWIRKRPLPTHSLLVELIQARLDELIAASRAKRFEPGT